MQYMLVDDIVMRHNSLEKPVKLGMVVGKETKESVGEGHHICIAKRQQRAE